MGSGLGNGGDGVLRMCGFVCAWVFSSVFCVYVHACACVCVYHYVCVHFKQQAVLTES